MEVNNKNLGFGAFSIRFEEPLTRKAKTIEKNTRALMGKMLEAGTLREGVGTNKAGKSFVTLIGETPEIEQLAADEFTRTGANVIKPKQPGNFQSERKMINDNWKWLSPQSPRVQEINLEGIDFNALRQELLAAETQRHLESAARRIQQLPTEFRINIPGKQAGK